VTYEALHGLGRPKATGFRIINATYSQAGMFMVRADSAYRSIADLLGKTVVWGAASSASSCSRATSWTDWATTLSRASIRVARQGR